MSLVDESLLPCSHRLEKVGEEWDELLETEIEVFTCALEDIGLCTLDGRLMSHDEDGKRHELSACLRCERRCP